MEDQGKNERIVSACEIEIIEIANACICSIPDPEIARMAFQAIVSRLP